MNWLYDLFRCRFAWPVYNGQQVLALKRCDRWVHLTGDHR